MSKKYQWDIFEKLLLILFVSGSLVFYGFLYNQHLCQSEQLQLFEVTPGYLIHKLSGPGGFADWLGESMIQFFHLPMAGALIITGLCLFLWSLTRRILFGSGQNRIPIIFAFLPATGYWILLMDPFYSVSGLAGLILSMLASLVYTEIHGSAKRFLSGIILLLLIYWLTGAAFIVFVSVVIISELAWWLKKDDKSFSPFAVLFFLVLAFAIPLTARTFIFRDTLLQAYISESYYKIRIFFPLPLILIFASMPLLILFRHLPWPVISGKSGTTLSGTALLLLPALMITGIMVKGDFREEREIAYENLAYGGSWNKIIKRAERERPSDKLSVTAVNLALAKTGKLSSEMFFFSQRRDNLFPGYSNRGRTPFITSDVYYYAGLVNFAQMFALETIESTIDVKYPSRSFRRAAETFIINGQYEVARKYLVPLSHTLFYGNWARNCLSLLGKEENINADPYWGYMRGIRPKYDFFYNINEMDVALQYLLVSNPDNKIAYEYLMALYLLGKNFDGFLQFLPLSEKYKYNGLPLAWQEAAAYIETRVNQVPQALANIELSNDVIEHIRSYASAFKAERSDTLKMMKDFGNTYWFYLHYR